MQHCVLSQLLHSLMGVFPLELSPRDVKMSTKKMQVFFFLTNSSTMLFGRKARFLQGWWKALPGRSGGEAPGQHLYKPQILANRFLQLPQAALTRRKYLRH